MLTTLSEQLPESFAPQGARDSMPENPRGEPPRRPTITSTQIELSEKELAEIKGGTMTAGDAYSGFIGGLAGVATAEGIAMLGTFMACTCPPVLAGIAVLGMVSLFAYGSSQIMNLYGVS